MKNEVNTTENNKLIAEFMGMKIINFKGIEYVENTGSLAVNTIDDLESFTYDWNWLMEVVEKIKQIIGFKMIDECTTQEWQVITNLTRLTIISAIDEVYNACVEFIKWYNENAAKR